MCANKLGVTRGDSKSVRTDAGFSIDTRWKPQEEWSERSTLWLFHSHGKSPFIIGKPSINGPFSMAMLNNQMVCGMPFAKCLVYLLPSFPIISHHLPSGKE